jgi:hypothetical protein
MTEVLQPDFESRMLPMPWMHERNVQASSKPIWGAA